MPSAAPVEPTARPRSPAQSEAARRNGARSRGPVSPEGKARASRNALRHGLCSSRSLAPGEDPEAFGALLADLRREAAPRSRLETLLLERLALTFWKLDRCDRLEATLATIEPHCPTGRLFPDPGLPRIMSRVPELSLLVRYQGQLGRDLQRLLKLVADPLLDRMAEADEPALGAPAEENAPDAPAAAEAAAAASPAEPAPGRPSSAPPGPGFEAELRRAARDDPALASALLEQLLGRGDIAGFMALERELRQAGPAAAAPPSGPAAREPALGPRAAAAPVPRAALQNEPEPLRPPPAASASRAEPEPVDLATACPAANRTDAICLNEPEPDPSRPASATAAAHDPRTTAPHDGTTPPPGAAIPNEPEPGPAQAGPSPSGEPGRAGDGRSAGPATAPPGAETTTRHASGPPIPAAPVAWADPSLTPERRARPRGDVPLWL